MNPLTTSAFDLPDHLAAKADPALIAGDERHFAAIAESLEQSIAELSDRLDAERKAPGGIGQEAMDRDLEIHRLTARLRALRRFGLDLCLGRIVGADDPEPVYIGRLGLTDSDGSPAAARLALPRGRAVLRRDPRQPDGSGQPPPVSLDPRPDQRLLGRGVHARTGSTGTPRSTTSPPSSPASAATGRPGCATCSAPSRPTRTRSSAPDPAARSSSTAVRAPARPSSRCTAPPTCCTPTRASATAAAACCSSVRTSPTSAYVADVLPSLGEEGVQTCTLRDLVAEGAAAADRDRPDVARLKSSADLVQAIEAAVRFYEEPPTKAMTVTTDWSDIRLSADDWAEAFDAPEPGTPHNEARDAGLGGAARDPDRQARRRRPGRTCCASRCCRTGSCCTTLQPGVAAARSGRPRRRPVVGARLPAQVRAVAQPRRGPRAAARGRPGLDGVRPAAAGRGPAAARRPGGVAAAAPAGGRRRRRARADGRRSSTT